MGMYAKSLQSCLTLCDAMDCSPPGSSLYGILQAKILQWVAMPSSRGSSRPRGQTQVSSVSCIGRRVLYQQRHWEALVSHMDGEYLLSVYGLPFYSLGGAF